MKALSWVKTMDKETALDLLFALETRKDIDCATRYALEMAVNALEEKTAESKPEKSSAIEFYARVIDYLNATCGTSYKASTEKTRKFIRSRVKEGFKEEDFYTVIRFKAEQWKNDEKMSAYLRPETLFGTKFENYLEQARKSVKTEQEIPEKVEAEMSDDEWLRMMSEDG